MGFPSDLFIQPVQQQFLCEICKQVLESPVLCRKCETIACDQCFGKLKNSNQPCPKCQISDFQIRKPFRAYNQVLGQLILNCPQQCGVQSSLERLQSHLQNQCTALWSFCKDCDKKNQRESISQHECIKDLLEEQNQINQEIVNYDQSLTQNLKNQKEEIENLKNLINVTVQQYRQEITQKQKALILICKKNNKIKQQINDLQQLQKNNKQKQLQEQFQEQQKKSKEEETKDEVIQILINDPVNNQFTVYINAESTVEQLKEQIESSKGIPIDQQRLIFATQQLEDSKRLSDCEIKNNSIVNLVMRLRGC